MFELIGKICLTALGVSATIAAITLLSIITIDIWNTFKELK